MNKIIIIFYLILSVLFIHSKEIKVKVIDKEIGDALEGVKIYFNKSGASVSTDAKGMARLVINDGEKRIILTAILIGYDPKKIPVEDFSKEIVVELSIKEEIEGRELVVEKESIGRTDEELGISKIMDDRQIKNSSKKGLVEDVFSSIKMLPGVSYSGSFDTRLSVRGGYPDDLTILYDGFMVRFPYHWGGMVSIFNPNVIDSVKFSDGIFSAKQGFAISGLLEIDSVKPDEGWKFDSILSTSTAEVFLQAPFGKTNSGLFIGGRLVYWDSFFLMDNYLKDSKVIQNDGMYFTTPPYIRDGYLKWFWKPDDKFEWYINGFFGSDGLHRNYDQEKDERSANDINIFMDNNWYNYDAFAMTGFKIMPKDNIFIHAIAGYEFLLSGLNNSRSENGEKSYSSDFLNNYEFKPGIGALPDSFRIDDLKSNYTMETKYNTIQSRFDIDVMLNDKIMLSTGTGITYDFLNYYSEGTQYQIIWDNKKPEYKKINFDSSQEDKQFLKSFLYLTFNFNIVPGIFKIDLGCRLDYDAMFIGSDYSFSTYPVAGPRLNFVYTPVRNAGIFESISFSAGAGIFTKVPFEEMNISREMNIKNFSIPMPKTVMAVLGMEMKFPFGFNFTIEGYYKYYFDRLYVNNKLEDDGDTAYKIHSDGIGHIAGFDLILERKISRYVDGWISYSFIYARYYNPESDGLNVNMMHSNAEPRGEWFYPSYHRFHTFNIVLNVRPVQWFTITASFTFASGTPVPEYGNVTQFAARLENGSVAEMYSREASYNDVLRSDFSIPFNLKFTFNCYFPKSKVKFEAYLGVDNLFVLFYKPAVNPDTNKYTGKDQQGMSRDNALNLPFPLPSIGINIDF